MEETKNEFGGDLNGQGGPTRPFHVVAKNWGEQTKKLEDDIRDRLPFEGTWQSYLDGFKVFIPTELRTLFSNGGVITASTEDHLLLFGANHWERFQRLLTKDVGLSPVNNEVARHTYEHMHRFDKLNDDGSISLTPALIRYADIDSDVIIIGVIYHAEVHSRDEYDKSQRLDSLMGRKERFRNLFK